MDRTHFLKHGTREIVCTIIAVLSSPSPSNAIEFVPASPYFSGTYQDAVEIMHAQRIAVDNIADVISDGNLEEAGFKVMQLAAQTRMAGKIILDTLQENISSSSPSLSSDNGIVLLRFLSCQKKFAVLLDQCDECGDLLLSAMQGKSGTKAVVQVKARSVVEETKSAYDDFLADLTRAEEAIGRDTRKQ